MQFEKVTLYHVSMPLVSPFATSFGSIANRECLMLEVRTGGLTGWGEVAADRDPGYAYETTGTAWHILKDFLIPPLLGQEIRDALDLHQQMAHVKGHPMAKAGLELALWDLIGKKEGCSLRELLGGERTRVEVGVSVGIQESPEMLLHVVADYLQDGYQRVKIKI